MIDNQTLIALQEEFKKIFDNTYELGGGYGFRYQHGVRVMNYCKKIAEFPIFKNESLNVDALMIAALFHDVGKIKAVDEHGQIIYGNYGDKSHEQLSAEITPGYIEKYIKDKDLIKLICLIIAEQEKGVVPTRTESKIIKDADRLDNYGVIHLWRTAVYSNYEKKNIEGLQEFWESEEGKIKCKNNLAKYFFPEVAAIAKMRYEKLDEVTRRMIEEQKGDDIVYEKRG